MILFTLPLLVFFSSLAFKSFPERAQFRAWSDNRRKIFVIWKCTHKRIVRIKQILNIGIVFGLFLDSWSSQFFQHPFQLLVTLLWLFKEQKQFRNSVLFVHFGFIFDLFGPVTKAKRRNRLWCIVSWRRYIDDEWCLAVSAQTFL